MQHHHGGRTGIPDGHLIAVDALHGGPAQQHPAGLRVGRDPFRRGGRAGDGLGDEGGNVLPGVVEGGQLIPVDAAGKGGGVHPGAVAGGGRSQEEEVALSLLAAVNVDAVDAVVAPHPDINARLAAVAFVELFGIVDPAGNHPVGQRGHVDIHDGGLAVLLAGEDGADAVAVEGAAGGGGLGRIREAGLRVRAVQGGEVAGIQVPLDPVGHRAGHLVPGEGDGAAVQRGGEARGGRRLGDLNLRVPDAADGELGFARRVMGLDTVGVPRADLHVRICEGGLGQARGDGLQVVEEGGVRPDARGGGGADAVNGIGHRAFGGAPVQLHRQPALRGGSGGRREVARRSPNGSPGGGREPRAAGRAIFGADAVGIAHILCNVGVVIVVAVGLAAGVRLIVPEADELPFALSRLALHTVDGGDGIPLLDVAGGDPSELESQPVVELVHRGRLGRGAGGDDVHAPGKGDAAAVVPLVDDPVVLGGHGGNAVVHADGGPDGVRLPGHAPQVPGIAVLRLQDEDGVVLPGAQGGGVRGLVPEGVPHLPGNVALVHDGGGLLIGPGLRVDGAAQGRCGLRAGHGLIEAGGVAVVGNGGLLHPELFRHRSAGQLEISFARVLDKLDFVGGLQLGVGAVPQGLQVDDPGRSVRVQQIRPRGVDVDGDIIGLVGVQGRMIRAVGDYLIFPVVLLVGDAAVAQLPPGLISHGEAGGIGYLANPLHQAAE